MSLVKNIHKNYGDFQLVIEELELLDAGITALWGPSGSGKSSVIRILLGLEKCEGWSWSFKGRDLAKLPIEQRNLAVVLQTYALFPHLSAAENIQFAAKARKRNSSESEKDFSRIVDQLKIERILRTPAKHLSGGEQQRVALARALISKPEFIFLDEPFSALDENLRVDARNITREMLSQWQIPALLVTHSRQDLDSLASRVTQISEGKLTTSK